LIINIENKDFLVFRKYLVGRSKKADIVIADEAVKRKILYVSLDEEGKSFIIPKTASNLKIFI